MLKIVLALGLASVAFASLPAHAQSSGAAAAARNYQCVDTDMSELQARGEKIADAGKKAEFMKEMKMAHDDMVSKNMVGCANHMGNLTNMFTN